MWCPNNLEDSGQLPTPWKEPAQLNLTLPMDPHGFLLQSPFHPWIPPPVHNMSTSSPSPFSSSPSSVSSTSNPLLMEFTWSPGGVDFPSGLHVLVVSIRTQGMFHKMHPQGIEYTIICFECLCKQWLPLPLDHRVLKYLTNGFYMQYIIQFVKRNCHMHSKCVFNGWCLFVHFMIVVSIDGKSSKHTSVMHLWEPFFNTNSMVMLVLWSERPYMASLANTQVW